MSGQTSENSARELYVGIDPGREKCGIALVGVDHRLEALHVCRISAMDTELKRMLADRTPTAVFIGDGTGSAEAKNQLAELFEGLEPVEVDESHSSEEARELYFRDHPPRGILRLVPRGLLTPGRMLDAYAAVIIVFRGLDAIKKYGNGV